MTRFLFLFSILLFTFNTKAQPIVYAFRVPFTNKIGSATLADSAQFLCQKALARRAKQGIVVNTSDIPINVNYINAVLAASNAIALHNVSKWFNQIVILTYNSNINAVKNLTYVDSANVQLVAQYNNGWHWKTGNSSTDKFNENNTTLLPPFASTQRGSAAYYGWAYNQIKISNGDYLHDQGYKGNGIAIAVFDAGFTGTTTNSYFDSLNLQNRIIDKWNFVNDTSEVFDFSTSITPQIKNHGTEVMSTMAANTPNAFVGTAPNANYYLYVTEDNFSEQPIEMDNWVSAAERADSIGVDIVNSSLGYNQWDNNFAGQNFTYADCNGHKSLIARAANMLVSKGVFCVNAIGNEGPPSAWTYLLTPADADSVYAVGSVDTFGKWVYTSSFGPASGGGVKPNGCSVGNQVAIIGAYGTPVLSGGTSYASPTLCGLVACLMQALPNKTVGEIKKMVEKSSSIYNNPTDSIGYGIPNFKYCYQTATGINEPTATEKNNYVVIQNNATKQINIKTINQDWMTKKIVLIDNIGKIIVENSFQNEITIPTANLANGIYSLIISTNNKTVFTKKISKN